MTETAPPGTGQQQGESAGDAGSILAWLDEKPTLSRHIGAARRLDQLHSAQPGGSRHASVVVIRNFTIEPIEPIVKVAAARAGMHLTLRYSGYDPNPDDLDELVAADTDVVVVALRLEDLASALARDFLATERDAVAALAADVVDDVAALVLAVRSRTRAAIVVHNFVPPVSPAGGIGDSQDPDGQLNTVRRMNLRLVERLRGMDGVHVLDADHVLSLVGLRQSHDERGDRVGGAPLSQDALRALADAYVRHIRALGGPSAKCVVLDCDNTLWGGVIGEDGIAKLMLSDTGDGRVYRDFQSSLLDLRRRGVLLTICSKNEENDVVEVLRKHPGAVLSESDFVAKRINWDDKADNIMSIAKELALGLEHFVFIDDNPVECEWVRARLPMVRVIQWTPDGLGVGGALDATGLFDSLVLTDEDRARTEMYQADAMRQQAMTDVADANEYLRSLQMRVTLGLAAPQHVSRLAQLTQRTNQFNLTTRRYDAGAMEQVVADPAARVVWLDLRDRFGASGVVGCGIVRLDLAPGSGGGGDAGGGRGEGEGEAIIDTFLLSCRVLGRRVEAVLAAELARLARAMGASTLVGEFIPSERNAQVADLYHRLGFTGPDGSGRWRWALDRGDPPVPDWFEIAHTEDD